MLTLKCHIEIKSKVTNKIVTFDYVNGIEVKTSCHNFTDKATVTVPRKMSWQGKPLTEFVRRNDEITIQAGYEEYGMETLFKGYVNSVENSTPLKIECENDMRLFKTTKVNAEVIPNFDIKAFLKRYAPGVTVECPDEIDFGTVTVQAGTLSGFLDQLKRTFSWFTGYFQDGVFYALINKEKLTNYNTVTFDPTRNQISDSLKYTLAEDVKIAVKATHINGDNTKIEVTVPEKVDKDYSTQHFYFREYDTEAELKEAAERKLKELKCDRMDGTIEAFGVPFVRKGDVVRLKDAERPERDERRFWVTAVDYKFNTSGYHQTITLGAELKSDMVK